MEQIERNVPAGLDIHMVLDKYPTYNTPKVAERFKKRPRYHLALHAHEQILAQLGGTMVLKQHRAAHLPVRIQESGPTHRGHRRLHRSKQPESQTLCVDRHRGVNCVTRSKYL